MPAQAADPQPWRVVDWRFLLSEPRLGHVWCAPACTNEAASLQAAGFDLSPEADSSVDTALVSAESFDSVALGRLLAPGTLVRLTVTAPEPRRLPRRRRSLRGRSRALEAAGWQVLSRAWAAPSVGWTRAYVEIGHRRTAVRALSLASAPQGAIGRVKLCAALALVRVGAGGLVCREGVILARTPS